MNVPVTICVEGNIGSGKTTFLDYFRKFPNVSIFDEPLSKWQNCQGFNLLECMYTDPQKWSFCFQSYVQLTMLDIHTKPVPQPFKLMERSIYSGRNCFTKCMHDAGMMNPVQYAVLSEWFDFSLAFCNVTVDLIVYLKTSPSVVYERVKKRNRQEETSITLDYLTNLHNLHETWLNTNAQLLPCKVITIDADLDLYKIVDTYEQCKEQIFQIRHSSDAV